MERLQGPINHWFLGEHLDVGCLEEELANIDNLRFGDDKAFNISSTLDLEDKMPFLQMLQSVESPPFVSMKEPSFQALFRLQHLRKPWELNSYLPDQFETQIHALEFESCITNDIVELPSHSPIKSEARDFQHPHSSSCNNQNPSSVENHCKESNSGSTPSSVKLFPKAPKQTQNYNKTPPSPRDRRKRKRTRLSKNKEEVECQRMTHIAVERNRRRQMNDHLNVLKSLMPISYIQRGDQASIVGGAIDFVKELEQLLQSLESRKRMRNSDGSKDGDNSVSSTSSSGLFVSESQCRIGSEEEKSSIVNQLTVQLKSDAADIEVTVIQTHVNLKIHCLRRPGQLLKAIVALEDLRLTVLHLNITSSQHTVFYSFNVKIEEGCELGSTEEIAGAVHQIFKFIEGS